MEKKIEAIIAKYMDAQPIHLIDVGAKGAVFSLGELDALVAGFAFEPNAKEYAALAPQKGIKYLPYALDDCAAQKNLYITQNPAYSSLLEWNEENFKKHFHRVKAYPKWEKAFQLERIEKVDCISLEMLFDQENIKNTSLLKLDTQGTELAILKGAEKLLKQQQIGLIFFEFSFIEIYRGQALFPDLDHFLKECNYTYVDCRFYPETFHRMDKVFSSKVYEKARYSIGGDAIFVADVNSLSAVESFKVGLILCQMTYYSMSSAYLKKGGLSDLEIEQLFHAFDKKKSGTSWRDYFPPILIKWMKTILSSN